MNMSIRDKIAKEQPDSVKQKKHKEPSWVEEGSKTTQFLYNAAIHEYHQITKKIENGDAKSVKECRLIRSKIAEKAGFDRSIVNPRRQLELCLWIDKKNKELETLSTIHRPLKGKRPPLKSKHELKREISCLRAQIKTQIECERREIIEEFFNSNLLDDRNALQKKNSRLKLENEHLHNKATRLQYSLAESEKLIARLISMLTEEQRIQLIGLSIVPNNRKN